MINIEKMTESTFEQAVELISRLQSDNSHHIGYFGTTSEELIPYIKELEPNWKETSLLAYEGKQLIGLLIIEYDLELEHAWLHGPMVDYIDWQTVANTLISTSMLEIIPKSIQDLELCGDVSNDNLRLFAEAHKFKSSDPSALLSFKCKDLEKLNSIQDPNIIKLNEEFFESFQQLHDKIWPNSYFSGKQLIERRSDRNKILLNIVGKKLRGYIRGGVEPGGKEGYIDFVTVNEDDRRKGIGKGLVTAITKWLLSSFEITSVGLSVYDTNIPAVNLYKKIGFNHARSIQGYRKKPAKTEVT